VSDRRTFAPVVLVGLAATAATAVAGHRSMLEASDQQLDKLGLVSAAGVGVTEAEFPLAGALALVAIACWGVILVARGRLRRVVAVLAALAAGGTFAVVVVGGFVQKDDAAADILDQLGGSELAGQLELTWTPWFWLALVASLIAVAAAVAAVIHAPAWPEMGSRYDAPSTHESTASEAPAEERTSLDLWKAMDEGDDPTDR
jgi:uncharacterized membrane protein (TIGR02234 family)